MIKFIAPFKTCGVSRHHLPLNLLNLLNPHTEGVSNGVRRYRHLERGCVPVWVVKALGDMKL